MKSEMFTDLVIKSLTGELNKYEQDEFEAWLNESETNRLAYQKIKLMWERMSLSYEKKLFNEEQAKEKIRLKIIQSQRIPRLHTRWIKISVAASILILIGVGLAAFYLTNIFNKEYLVYTSGDTIKKIILTDSSFIWLNENSQLKVPGNFSGNHRDVALDGEAYFEIKRNEDSPFKIHAGNTVVKVLGTSFNIRVEKSSGDVSVIVKSGKVAFYRMRSPWNSKTLTAGSMGRYVVQNNDLASLANTDRNFLSWKTGILTFKDTPLSEVCGTLSAYYKTDIKTEVNDSGLTLTGSFQNERLEEVLNTLELTLNIEAKNTQKGIVFIRK
jgi:transmembrane sensor